MNKIPHPPHLIHNIFLSILLIGLSVLTIFSCGEESLTGSQEMQPPSQSRNAIATTELEDSFFSDLQTNVEKDPQQNHQNFVEMLSAVENMEREDIEGFTDEQLLEFGKPILDVTENTIELPQKLLHAIDEQISALNLNMRELNKAQLESIKRHYGTAIKNNTDERPGIRKLKVKYIRRMLLSYYDSVHTDTLTVKAVVSPPTTMCQSLFNQIGNSVYLYPGDNLSTANFVCPPSSLFYLTSGTYYNQSIQNPGNGSLWAGQGANTKLNGNGNAQSAFYGDIKNVSIQYFTIENYTENGIYSGNTFEINDIYIAHMNFNNIAPNKDGESNGGVNLYKCQDVQVSDTHFEDVASAILLTHCDGPLKAIDNEALNPGRNFFQCNDCEGAGIRVNGNSLEHTTGYGNTVLEDWINIYASEGTDGDYIQVNDNRARVLLNNGQATKVSNTGCMIILGDLGGKFQEAKNNIGVNPGNCGIGVAGGSDFRVFNNQMFSEQIMGISNVGIYGYAVPASTPCSFPPNTFQNNKASFICGQDTNGTDCGLGLNNWAWAPEDSTKNNYCGVDIGQIRDPSRVHKDLSLNADIWNQW